MPVHNQIADLHVITMPLSDAHTGENIMVHIEHIVVALDHKFLSRVISITTVGAATMTAKENEAVTFLQKKTVAPVARF